MKKSPTTFDIILSDAQIQFQNALSYARGKKILVVDEKVSGIISRVADASILKEHAIENIFYLTHQAILADARTLVYVCRPELSSMLNIISHIQHDAKQPPQTERNYLIYCLPRTNLLCKHLLEERGVLANVELHDLLLEFLPLEKDLFSLEIASFHSLYQHKDVSPLFQLALSLLSLESVVGPFTCIRGKGEFAKNLLTILEKKRGVESLVPSSDEKKKNTLILLDRSVDFLTLFLVQLTYAGLLDTFKGMQSGYIDLDPTTSRQKPKKFKLSREEDSVYKELADLHFSAVTGCLQKHAKDLKIRANERHNANTINDIYQFVERLPEIQKKQEHLPIHLSLAESLSEKMDETFYKYLDSQKKLLLNQQLDWDFLQELISRFYPLHFVLSLICLSSELGALTEKQLQILKTDLIQTYGISCMTLWSHLSQLGLLHGPRKYSLYSSLRKSWQLHTESPAPYDVSSVYDGYVPMSVRIVQYILTNQQNLIEKHGNGPSVSHKGPLTSSVYVCFIGGVTFSEVTCLRALAKTIPRLNQLIILTTEILNPQKLFGIDREEKLVVGL